MNQADAARALIASLADAGVENVIVCPGSRSTPLVLASLAEPRLAVTNVIDERSAAFYALGQARVTGRPSLVITTSGTAGAHAYPAVIEASTSYLPMLIATADRPLDLQDCGALQTIDQRDLFGRHVRASFEVALTGARALERMGARAVQATLHPLPGPVHLNLACEKPLEAEPSHAELRRAPRFMLPRSVPDRALIDELAARAIEYERGLIVAGPMPLEARGSAAVVRSLSNRTGWPILAEATSQLRFTGARAPLSCDVFEPILRSTELAPELILQLGRTPTSNAFELFVRRHPDALRVVASPFGVHDPFGSASLHALVDPCALVGALDHALASRAFARPRTRWAESFMDAERRARIAVLRERTGGEAGLVYETLAGAARDALLFAGNGLPIRHLDLFADGDTARVSVLSQRGASGIDGLISGAAGSASVAGGRPLIALIGDVSALHDLSGLRAARGVQSPLVIVVIHNDGGRIFEQLPIGAHPAIDHFTTPHGTELVHAARLFRAPFHRVESLDAFRACFAAAQSRAGATLIEARVAPHDAREAYRRIYAVGA